MKLKYILIIAVVILLVLFSVFVGKNHKLEGEMFKQEQMYQDSLSTLDDQLVESAKYIQHLTELSDSLEVLNSTIDQRQQDIINNADENRRQRYEELVDIKYWSDDKRDEFWARELTIQDTLIPIPN
tara:strand:+ start:1687 stop:2067 length:381 start_codon:yes stop_codon:yes gene_type:complete